MIYVLEDDASIQKLVVYTLNSQGMEARGFDRPSQFWSALALEKPELVLLDIMLPEEDGLQVLKKLRADPATRRTPVLMLTAKSTEYDKVLGLDQRGSSLRGGRSTLRRRCRPASVPGRSRRCRP